MTDKQPEALRLADELDAVCEDGADPDLIYDAAAELRRLHQERTETEALLRQAKGALESADWYINQLEMIVYPSDDTGTHEERAKVQSAITAIKERLGESAK